MMKNKGIIGIGLILAIVLGVVVVGGGAYYLGKNKGENNEINNQDQNLQPENQDQQVVENNKKVNTQSKLTIYNSNTYGYEIGYSGIDSKNVYITGDGKNINLFSNQSNVDAISVIDLATFLPAPDSVYKGTVTFGNNQYKKFKNNTIPRSTTYLISGLKNNKSILISVENDSDNPNYLDLSSLKINTINPGTNTVNLSTFSSKYISPYPGQWPPVVQHNTTAYSCSTISRDVFDTPTTLTGTQKNISGRKFCLYSFSDVGAGHAAGVYTYITAGLNGSGTERVDFRLDWPNGCGAYDGLEYSQCKNDQSTFFDNLDSYIASLM